MTRSSQAELQRPTDLVLRLPDLVLQVFRGLAALSIQSFFSAFLLVFHLHAGRAEQA